MILIGEKINSSIKSVYEAIINRDEEKIKSLVTAQEEAGVSYLDINAGAFLGEEYQNLLWLMETVSKYSDLPLVIDTPNSEVALKIAEVYKGEPPIINSITTEKKRFKNMLSAAKCCNSGLVALCMDDENDTECVSIACKLVNMLVQNGIKSEDIYVDPLIKPLGSGDNFGKEALKNISNIRRELPDVHIVCGLSNVSYGLPQRTLINRTFLSSAMTAGLDSAIINPLDKELMKIIYAQNVILGKDEYCMEYIQAFRENKL